MGKGVIKEGVTVAGTCLLLIMGITSYSFITFLVCNTFFHIFLFAFHNNPVMHFSYF